MAALPPRRPGQPYGGSEERTPLPLSPSSLNEQVIILRHHQDRAFEAIERLANTVNGIMETLHGSPGKFEDAIVGKVIAHEKRRRFWDKVIIGVWTAVLIAIIGVALRISWIVQTNRLP